VHVNPATDLAGQQAFKRLHETSHDLFTWQHVDDGRDGFADDLWTLSPKTQILFEREANQGAAELLFQRERFAAVGSDYAVSGGAVIELAERFGSSIHAAFRRYVETHRGAVAGVVLEARQGSDLLRRVAHLVRGPRDVAPCTPSSPVRVRRPSSRLPGPRSTDGRMEIS
jgi:hypothetical protein